MTYKTWGFHWWTSWSASLPVYLHSIIRSLLSCISLLKSWLARKQQTHDKTQLVTCVLLLKLHIWLLSGQQKVCCARAVHKFVTVLLPWSKILTTEERHFVLQFHPHPCLPRHYESRSQRLLISKAQGTFKWNVKVYLLIFSHFKLIKTPKTRMTFIQIKHCAGM